MSERTTYRERQIYSARVMRFRKAVYEEREGMTNGCRVLLLRLSDDMDAKAIVSIPRTQLAEDLSVAPARISEGIKLARKLGFLDIVKRARPKVTAVYQGLTPTSEVRPTVPLDDDQRYATQYPLEVRPAVPLSEVQRYALPPTQEVGATARIGAPLDGNRPGRSIEGDGSTEAVDPLSARWATTDCPHGIPNGERARLGDRDRNPQCPGCHEDAREGRGRWSA